MKRSVLRISACALLLSSMSSVLALTPRKRADIQDLIRNINSGSVSGSGIIDAIKKLNVTNKDDLNDALINRKDGGLNQVAYNALKNQGYDITSPYTLVQDIMSGTRPQMITKVQTITAKNANAIALDFDKIAAELEKSTKTQNIQALENLSKNIEKGVSDLATLRKNILIPQEDAKKIVDAIQNTANAAKVQTITAKNANAIALDFDKIAAELEKSTKTQNIQALENLSKNIEKGVSDLATLRKNILIPQEDAKKIVDAIQNTANAANEAQKVAEIKSNSTALAIYQDIKNIATKTLEQEKRKTPFIEEVVVEEPAPTTTKPETSVVATPTTPKVTESKGIKASFYEKINNLKKAFFGDVTTDINKIIADLEKEFPKNATKEEVKQIIDATNKTGKEIAKKAQETPAKAGIFTRAKNALVNIFYEAAGSEHVNPEEMEKFAQWAPAEKIVLDFNKLTEKIDNATQQPGELSQKILQGLSEQVSEDIKQKNIELEKARKAALITKEETKKIADAMQKTANAAEQAQKGAEIKNNSFASRAYQNMKNTITWGINATFGGEYTNPDYLKNLEEAKKQKAAQPSTTPAAPEIKTPTVPEIKTPAAQPNVVVSNPELQYFLTLINECNAKPPYDKNTFIRADRTSTVKNSNGKQILIAQMHGVYTHLADNWKQYNVKDLAFVFNEYLKLNLKAFDMTLSDMVKQINNTDLLASFSKKVGDIFGFADYAYLNYKNKPLNQIIEQIKKVADTTKGLDSNSLQIETSTIQSINTTLNEITKKALINSRLLDDTQNTKMNDLYVYIASLCGDNTKNFRDFLTEYSKLTTTLVNQTVELKSLTDVLALTCYAYDTDLYSLYNQTERLSRSRTWAEYISSFVAAKDIDFTNTENVNKIIGKFAQLPKMFTDTYGLFMPVQDANAYHNRGLDIPSIVKEYKFSSDMYNKSFTVEGNELKVLPLHKKEYVQLFDKTLPLFNKLRTAKGGAEQPSTGASLQPLMKPATPAETTTASKTKWNPLGQ